MAYTISIKVELSSQDKKSPLGTNQEIPRGCGRNVRRGKVKRGTAPDQEVCQEGDGRQHTTPLLFSSKTLSLLPLFLSRYAF